MPTETMSGWQSRIFSTTDGTTWKNTALRTSTLRHPVRREIPAGSTDIAVILQDMMLPDVSKENEIRLDITETRICYYWGAMLQSETPIWTVWDNIFRNLYVWSWMLFSGILPEIFGIKILLQILSCSKILKMFDLQLEKPSNYSRFAPIHCLPFMDSDFRCPIYPSTQTIYMLAGNKTWEADTKQ